MKKMLAFLCVIGIVLGAMMFQSHSHQQLFQAIDAWQSRNDRAHLNGKSPAEVAAYLDAWGVAHTPYSNLEQVRETDGTHLEGYILAHTRTTHILISLAPSDYWTVEMSYRFDEHNKCRSSYVWASNG